MVDTQQEKKMHLTEFNTALRGTEAYNGTAALFAPNNHTNNLGAIHFGVDGIMGVSIGGGTILAALVLFCAFRMCCPDRGAAIWAGIMAILCCGACRVGPGAGYGPAP